MERWYITHCQSKNLMRILKQATMLSSECYLPVETRITRRKDCGGTRFSQKPLFPGYLFIRFDLEVIHPEKFTDINGIYYFLTTGEKLCVIDDEIVNALKCVHNLRFGPSGNCVQCTNFSAALISSIQRIYTISGPLERQVELLKLLQSDNF
ncbi:transcription termination/antitermination NusG family protein [Pantoea agglomerans]|uniref:transcription termination/antitermination NusG family protein n=1 Tax=Enterobacter agglomerans TaxID=549 RepID=UPI001044A048|nr:transcription termination/antitermination NusG family protein [Pantoea agglomerans]TCZ24166.1 hypothetical protein EYB39_17395 [Pantoea agglomerans]